MKPEEDYVRFIFKKVPAGVWTTDRELRITHADGRALGFELDAEKLIGRTIQDVLGTEDPTDPAVAHHLAALTGSSHSFTYSFHGRWMEALVEPLRDARGDVRGCIGAVVDLTERRLAEEGMERSRRGLEEAQRVAHIGSFEWDIAQNRVTWSDELFRIYGIQKEEFPGTYEGFLRQVHPDDLARAKEVIFSALRSGKPFAYEHRIRRPDGSIVTLHTRGDVIKDSAGNPVRIAGSCWDVTALREATRKLELSVSLLHATIHATADGILVVDRAGKVVTCNSSFLTLWRIPAELAERGEDDALLAFVVDQLEDREGFLRGVRELYRQPEVESWDTIRFRDGRVFERHSTAQRLGDEVVGRVWTFHDVTERERLLRRAMFLADATRLLSSLEVENALEGVANLALPYLGHGCAIDLVKNGGVWRRLAVSRDPARPMSSELDGATRGGQAAIFALEGLSHMAVPLTVKGIPAGTIMFAAPPGRLYSDHDLDVAKELAHRIELSLENAQLYREAQRALQAREEFLSIAAHEIRNPITAMHLAVQSLQQGTLSPADSPVALRVIEREDRRLARFVDELLDFARIRSDRIHLELEEVDLGEVVREVVQRSAAELARSGSTLTVTIRSAAVGQWDRLRLDQVVTNLLSNAMKFGERQPIVVTIDVRNGNATLVVEDRGPGIPPERHDAIFRPFERAVSTRHYGGLGLGLYIVRTIVEALGGTIHVDSKPGATKFVVELPMRRIH